MQEYLDAKWPWLNSRLLRSLTVENIRKLRSEPAEITIDEVTKNLILDVALVFSLL